MDKLLSRIEYTIKKDAEVYVKYGYEYNLVRTRIIIFCFCVLPHFFAIQREQLYQALNNIQLLTWILDTFLSPSIVFQELKRRQWLKIMGRLMVYFYSILFFPMTILLMVLFFTSVIYAMMKRYNDWLQYNETFNYQSLPLTVQRRFHQLQSPVTRYNLSRACFNPFLAPEYNDLYIDQLYIMKQEGECPRFYSYYDIDIDEHLHHDIEALTPKISFRCYYNSKCTCSRQLFNKFQVSKTITVSHIPARIQLYDLPLFNKISPKELIITNSVLSATDLERISQLNLDFIKLSLLFDGTNFQNKMNDILVAVAGTPKIRTHYESQCDDLDGFHVSMYEWLNDNNYVQSIECREEFQIKCFWYTKS